MDALPQFLSTRFPRGMSCKTTMAVVGRPVRSDSSGNESKTAAVAAVLLSNTSPIVQARRAYCLTRPQVRAGRIDGILRVNTRPHASSGASGGSAGLVFPEVDAALFMLAFGYVFSAPRRAFAGAWGRKTIITHTVTPMLLRTPNSLEYRGERARVFSARCGKVFLDARRRA